MINGDIKWFNKNIQGYLGFKDIYYLSLFSYSRKRHIQLAKLPVCRVTHIALIYLLFDIYHVQARCFLGTCCVLNPLQRLSYCICTCSLWLCMRPRPIELPRPFDFQDRPPTSKISKTSLVTTAYANYCGPFLPNPLCQFSMWEETGVPGENPQRPAERWVLFFSHEDWVEPAASEVKGNSANHLATEAPIKRPKAILLNSTKYPQVKKVLNFSGDKH
jgi:hypothetical protein